MTEQPTGSRKQVRDLARAYFKLLSSIDWADDLLVAGLREGLNKFLSNAHLAQYRGRNKYHKTHFISQAALDRLTSKGMKHLRFEHMVPKQRYLQSVCEAGARVGTLTEDQVFDLLDRYWYMATITDEEERRLELLMPDDWDQQDILARYKRAGIELQRNSHFHGAAVKS